MSSKKQDVDEKGRPASCFHGDGEIVEVADNMVYYRKRRYSMISRHHHNR